MFEGWLLCDMHYRLCTQVPLASARHDTTFTLARDSVALSILGEELFPFHYSGCRTVDSTLAEASASGSDTQSRRVACEQSHSYVLTIRTRSRHIVAGVYIFRIGDVQRMFLASFL